MTRIFKGQIYTATISGGGFGSGYGDICGFSIRNEGCPVLETCSSDRTEFVSSLRPEISSSGEVSLAVHSAGLNICVGLPADVDIREVVINFCTTSEWDKDVVQKFATACEKWVAERKEVVRKEA